MALTLICNSGVQTGGAPVCADAAQASAASANVTFNKVLIFSVPSSGRMSGGVGQTSERAAHPNSERGASLAASYLKDTCCTVSRPAAAREVCLSLVTPPRDRKVWVLLESRRGLYVNLKSYDREG